jgi:hypothetical protein
MRTKGFDPTWCDWLQQYIEKGSVGIRVNDGIGHYFQTMKGPRQGAPLSPILLNIAIYILAIMIQIAKDDGQVSNLIPHLVDGGISILQYDDDTILFVEHNIGKALNMKFVLCIFEQLSGLKINFHKSEFFCFRKAKEMEVDYKTLFGCDIGLFPFRYLGIPIHFRRPKNGEWKLVEDRFEKNSRCAGKMLSYGNRITPNNSFSQVCRCLCSRFLRFSLGSGKE